MVVGITLEQQLACARREYRLRERVYPRLIHQGKMQPGEAQDELDAMQAIVETLDGLLREQLSHTQPYLPGVE